MGGQSESVLPKSESAPRGSESDPGRNPTRVGVGLTEKFWGVGSESDFRGSDSDSEPGSESLTRAHEGRKKFWSLFFPLGSEKVRPGLTKSDRV